MAQDTNDQPQKYGRRYPWTDWFKNKEFTLVAGRDFNGRAYTFAGQVRDAAARKRFGLRVSTEVSDDESTVTVRVLGPLDPTVPSAEDPVRRKQIELQQQQAREKMLARRCGLPHNQYVLLKALEDGEPHTYRELVMATGIYSSLPVDLRARHDDSLVSKGLVREVCWDIDGRQVVTFQITAKGREVLDSSGASS